MALALAGTRLGRAVAAWPAELGFNVAPFAVQSVVRLKMSASSSWYCFRASGDNPEAAATTPTAAWTYQNYPGSPVPKRRARGRGARPAGSDRHPPASSPSPGRQDQLAGMTFLIARARRRRRWRRAGAAQARPGASLEGAPPGVMRRGLELPLAAAPNGSGLDGCAAAAVSGGLVAAATASETAR